MRIDIVKFEDRRVTRLQDNVNKALARLPFDYAERISFVARPSEFPRVIAHHMPKPAWGLQPVYLRNLTSDAAYPASGWFVDWIPESGGIKIRGINGLTSTSLYQFEFIAYG